MPPTRLDWSTHGPRQANLRHTRRTSESWAHRWACRRQCSGFQSSVGRSEARRTQERRAGSPQVPKRANVTTRCPATRVLSTPSRDPASRSSQSGKAEVSHPARFDQVPRDASLRIAGHVDHAPSPCESILEARLQNTEFAVTRIHGQLAFLDLPRSEERRVGKECRSR